MYIASKTQGKKL
jgi:hypothetical protein